MTNLPRRQAVGITVALAMLGTLVSGAPAQALTLGDTAPPNGARGVVCSSSGLAEVLQTSTDPGFQYTVPAGGGTINSWSFNTTGARPNTPYELLVTRPTAATTRRVIATDTEIVPARGTVATFSLADPIAVQGGDELGIVSHGSQNTVVCLFRAGPLNGSDIVGNGAVNNGSGNPPNGSSFSIERSTPGELVNVSANLVQSDDVGLTQRVLPDSIAAGGDAAFVLSLTGSGPSSSAIDLTDAVPAGLAIRSVSAGSAPCSVSGQDVSCVLATAPATVTIVVSALRAGHYVNFARAQGLLTDPNAADNGATGTLEVSSGSPAQPVTTTAGVIVLPAQSDCQVIALRKVPLALAKRVIRALGCSVGKVTRERSRSVRRGEVIFTRPRAGTTARLGTRVAIVVSSGRPRSRSGSGRKRRHHLRRR